MLYAISGCVLLLIAVVAIIFAMNNQPPPAAPVSPKAPDARVQEVDFQRQRGATYEELKRRWRETDKNLSGENLQRMIIEMRAFLKEYPGYQELTIKRKLNAYIDLLSGGMYPGFDVPPEEAEVPAEGETAPPEETGGMMIE